MMQIWDLLKKFRPDASASPFIRILLCLLAFVVLGCHAVTLKQPTVTAKFRQRSYSTGDWELTCVPHGDDTKSGGTCETLADCAFEWYIDDAKLDGEVKQVYVPKRNAVYTCKVTSGGHDTSSASINTGPGKVQTLPQTPCIELPAKGKCGDAVKITCKAAGQRDCAAGTGTGATKGMGVGYNDTTKIMAEIGRKAAKQTLEVTVTAVNGQFWCLAHTVHSVHITGGLTSISEPKTMTCKGDDSGASDIGRPASVLTIVCSLLALTLSLRG